MAHQELEVARGAALHVVAIGVEALRSVLEASDSEEDLQLPEQRHQIPRLEWAHASQLRKSDVGRRRQTSGEVDVVDVELKSNKSSLHQQSAGGRTR
jgi:hypothetical protein